MTVAPVPLFKNHSKVVVGYLGLHEIDAVLIGRQVPVSKNED